MAPLALLKRRNRIMLVRMVSIVEGANKYVFYAHGQPPGPEAEGIGGEKTLDLSFTHLQQAIRFLLPLQQSIEFRRLASVGWSIDVHRLSPDEMVQQIAGRLLSGRLRVQRRWRQAQAASSNKIERAPPPTRMAPAVKAYVPPAPEPFTFSESHDPSAQTRTLKAAARNGIPFCEECERLRKAAVI